MTTDFCTKTGAAAPWLHVALKGRYRVGHDARSSSRAEGEDRDGTMIESSYIFCTNLFETAEPLTTHTFSPAALLAAWREV
jgi:hypothetical protein